ncbi:hypothetical protein [Raoultella planticola]|uniref:hypothetical protein n=1 Tax=Raoultella planticola TaxID=575 RepID=UPI00103396F2|nr:hypothetical protein [Raoultella planticola]
MGKYKANLLFISIINACVFSVSAGNLSINVGAVDLTGQAPGTWIKANTTTYTIAEQLPSQYNSCPSGILLCTSITGTVTNVGGAGGTSGIANGYFYKTPVTQPIGNGASVIFDISLNNMAMYLGMERYGTAYQTSAARFRRISLWGVSESDLGESRTIWNSGHWNTATTSWDFVATGCGALYNSCPNGVSYAGLTTAGSFSASATGNIDVYVKVPESLSAGTHTFNNVRLGSLRAAYQPNGSAGVTNASITTYLYANITITVPQRCSVTFPSSATFSQIKGTEPASSTPLEKKSLTFVSKCNNLGTATVKATLTLSPEEQHSTYSAAVFPNSDSTIGITASLSNGLNCHATSNELFSTGSLLATHTNNIPSVTQNVYFGLCKFGVITKPGTYTTSMNATVRYDVTS